MTFVFFDQDDDVTLRDDGRRSGDMYSCEDTVDNSCNDDNIDIDSTSMMSLPQLRRTSWEAIEPVVHDHHQLSLPAGSNAVVVDRLDSPVVAPAAPPVSWLPHLRREVRHLKLLKPESTPSIFFCGI